MKNRNKVFIGVVTLSVLVMGITAVIGYSQISNRKNDYITYLQAKENAKNGGSIEESIEVLDDIEKKYGESDVIKLEKADIYLNSGDSSKAQIELSNAFTVNNALYSNKQLMLLYSDVAYSNGDIDTAKELLNNINEKIKEEEKSAKENNTEVSDETKEIKEKVKNKLKEME